MSRVDSRQRIMPSLLDRLGDPVAAGDGSGPGFNLAQIIGSVRRDLEELLNTRQSHQGLPPEFTELHKSVHTYGVPDFASISISEPGEIGEMGRILEEVIAKFEPRLRDVRAVVAEYPEGEARHVRFHIEARLRLDPFPTVEFETVVELLSGHTSIRSRNL